MNIRSFFLSGCRLDPEQILASDSTKSTIIPLLENALSFIESNFLTPVHKAFDADAGFIGLHASVADSLEYPDRIVYESISQILLVQELVLITRDEISSERAIIEGALQLLDYLPALHNGLVSALSVIELCLEILSTHDISVEKLIMIGKLSTLGHLSNHSCEVLSELSERPMNSVKKGFESSKEAYMFDVINFLLNEIRLHYSRLKRSKRLSNDDRSFRRSDRPKKKDLYAKVQSVFPKMTKEGFLISERDKWLNRLIDYSLEIYSLQIRLTHLP